MMSRFRKARDSGSHLINLPRGARPQLTELDSILSESPITPRFTARRIVPTAEQEAIQVARKRMILVEAIAGAAKTTTLALRIAESMARGAPPEQILVLVFTRAARQAMLQRLKEIGVEGAKLSRLTIETFNDFAQAILRKIEGAAAPTFTRYKDLRPFVIQAQEAMAEKYQDRHALEISGTNTAVTEFLRLQLRTKARMDLHAQSEEALERPLDERLQMLGMSITNYLWIQEYERIRGAHIEEVRFRGHLDATYDLVRLMEKEPDLRGLLPEYQVILADELHDLNEVTFRFLTMLIKRSGAFFCGAGDKDQVIYTWSGADHQFLKSRFAQMFPYLERFPLTASFRYGPQLAEAMGVLKGKASTSAVRRSTAIALTTYDHTLATSCGDAVVAAVRQWERDGNDVGDIAILLRDRHQSIRVENALFQHDIPYDFVAMRSFLAQQEVLMMRGMLAIARKNLAAVQSSELRSQILEALIEFAEVPFTQAEMQEAKKDIAEFPDLLEGFITNHILKSPNAEKREATFAALRYLEELSPDTPAADALAMVAELMKVGETARRIYVDPAQAAVVIRSIAGFIDICRESGKTLESVSAWLGEMEFSVSNQKKRHTLTIACIDQVKGLEYRHVIIPNLETDEFPRRGGDLLEETNRFYVAATRARDRLTLLAPAAPERTSVFVGKMEIARSVSRGDALLRKSLLKETIAERDRPT